MLRVTLTRGPTLRGLSTDGENPSIIISLGAFDRVTVPASVRLATTSIRRNATSPASRLKTLSYIDAIAAAREVATHADDALMLNTHGNVACATVANIFLLKAKMLITPADDQAVLKGITRGKLIEGASKLGLSVECRAVRPAELHGADAVFFTNSLRLAVPVASVDGAACGNKPITFIHTFLIATK